MHDVATREERLLGSELAFVHFYLVLDRVPKYSTKQSLPLYNPFKLDAEISRKLLMSSSFVFVLNMFCLAIGRFVN